MSDNNCRALPRDSCKRIPQIPFPSSKAVSNSQSTHSRHAVPFPIKQTTTEVLLIMDSNLVFNVRTSRAVYDFAQATIMKVDLEIGSMSHQAESLNSCNTFDVKAGIYPPLTCM